MTDTEFADLKNKAAELDHELKQKASETLNRLKKDDQA